MNHDEQARDAAGYAVLGHALKARERISELVRAGEDISTRVIDGVLDDLLLIDVGLDLLRKELRLRAATRALCENANELNAEELAERILARMRQARGPRRSNRSADELDVTRDARDGTLG
jgi:hypothetical protein